MDDWHNPRNWLMHLALSLLLLSPASVLSASTNHEPAKELPHRSAAPIIAAEEKEGSAAEFTSSNLSVRSRKGSKGLSMSQLIRKYPETLKTGGPRKKMLALTFDDVPDPRFTPQLLDILKQNHIKATFFVVGSRAEKHPDLVAQIIKEGHVIGNHSYNHPQFTKLQMNEFRNQILRTEGIIQAQTGYKPRLIRPPYGDISEQQLIWAKSHGYKLVNWNVDSLDWKGLSKVQVRNNILAHANKGSIILQHGGGGKGSNLQGTLQALPEVIAIMQNRGYTFVTVPQLLDISKSK